MHTYTPHHTHSSCQSSNQRLLTVNRSNSIPPAPLQSSLLANKNRLEKKFVEATSGNVILRGMIQKAQWVKRAHGLRQGTLSGWNIHLAKRGNYGVRVRGLPVIILHTDNVSSWKIFWQLAPSWGKSIEYIMCLLFVHWKVNKRSIYLSIYLCEESKPVHTATVRGGGGGVCIPSSSVAWINALVA